MKNYSNVLYYLLNIVISLLLYKSNIIAHKTLAVVLFVGTLGMFIFTYIKKRQK